jgi:hypothetical protein
MSIGTGEVRTIDDDLTWETARVMLSHQLFIKRTYHPKAAIALDFIMRRYIDKPNRFVSFGYESDPLVIPFVSDAFLCLGLALGIWYVLPQKDVGCEWKMVVRLGENIERTTNLFKRVLESSESVAMK